MVEVLEFITAFIAFAIYGSEERPRHPIWRSALRVLVFGGALIGFAGLFPVLSGISIPVILVLIWGGGLVTVMFGEYSLGNDWVMVGALVAGVVVVGLHSIL